MSDDYDPAEDAGFEDIDADAEAPEEEKENSDSSTDSETDNETGSDESEDEAEDEAEESGSEPGVKTIKVKAPPKQKVDPIAKFSGTAREVIIVAPNDRRTSNIMQLPELAAAIAIRAQMMENFSPSYVKDEKSTDSVQRATTELYSGNCPLKLRRQIGTGPNGERICEEWTVREMTLPPIA